MKFKMSDEYLYEMKFKMSDLKNFGLKIRNRKMALSSYSTRKYEFEKEIAFHIR